MDFLKRFGAGEGDVGHSVKEEDVELSLGLSLNGHFGVKNHNHNNNNNNNNNGKLIRASSIADFSSFGSVTEDPTPLTLYPLTPLNRTCSLPIEPEVEWKKRKELQSLRRSEAKRKRVEKISKNGNFEIKKMNGNESLRSSPPAGLPPLPRPTVVPAVGSPGSGGSSGVSDLESQPFMGTNKDAELNSTASQQSVLHKNSSSIPCRSNSVASEHASKNLPVTSSKINGENRSRNDTLKMMLADMPCVSTKGDGVNGKKIEGFLYRYRKGEEVRIVCVCHGSFLTPAEFVKHGGGGDVEYPLRHIVVNPPSL
uniref:ninja-family protein AFP3-like n=1 Tax=Erigeron canadensis TaxID=72917 RepID=UPI001CB98D57|nr:ninja-family protein AFP3-like [Erigeron canadensis]